MALKTSLHIREPASRVFGPCFTSPRISMLAPVSGCRGFLPARSIPLPQLDPNRRMAEAARALAVRLLTIEVGSAVLRQVVMNLREKHERSRRRQPFLWRRHRALLSRGNKSPQISSAAIPGCLCTELSCILRAQIPSANAGAASVAMQDALAKVVLRNGRSR